LYILKSEIIEQIQYFHRLVFELYLNLYGKVENSNVKILLAELCQQEKLRDEYLKKHKKITKAMNSRLTFQPNKLSNYISECFKNVKTSSNLSVDDIVEIEMHFDDHLIKLFDVLSNEEKNNGNITNIFYYMINKIKQEDIKLQEKLTNLNL